MKKRELRHYEMLVRVRDFGITHGERFPDALLAGQSFTTVGQSVKELTEHAVAQMVALRQAAKARAAAREQLLDGLEAISRTARVIEAATPGFQNPFQVPERRHAPALLTAGRAFVREAAPAAALFTARGL